MSFFARTEAGEDVASQSLSSCDEGAKNAVPMQQLKAELQEDGAKQRKANHFDFDVRPLCSSALPSSLDLSHDLRLEMRAQCSKLGA